MLPKKSDPDYASNYHDMDISELMENAQMDFLDMLYMMRHNLRIKEEEGKFSIYSMREMRVMSLILERVLFILRRKTIQHEKERYSRDNGTKGTKETEKEIENER
jgi:hypothetical protein